MCSPAPTPIMVASSMSPPKGPARPRRCVTADGGASRAARGLGSATSAPGSWMDGRRRSTCFPTSSNVNGRLVSFQIGTKLFGIITLPLTCWSADAVWLYYYDTSGVDGTYPSIQGTTKQDRSSRAGRQRYRSKHTHTQKKCNLKATEHRS